MLDYIRNIISRFYHAFTSDTYRLLSRCCSIFGFRLVSEKDFLQQEQLQKEQATTLHTLEKSISDYEARVQRIQDYYQECEHNLRNLEFEYRILENKFSDLQSRHESLQKDLDESNERAYMIEREKEALESHLEDVQQYNNMLMPQMMEQTVALEYYKDLLTCYYHQWQQAAYTAHFLYGSYLRRFEADRLLHMGINRPQPVFSCSVMPAHQFGNFLNRVKTHPQSFIEFCHHNPLVIARMCFSLSQYQELQQALMQKKNSKQKIK